MSEQLLLFEDVPAEPVQPAGGDLPGARSDGQAPEESDWARDLRLRMQAVTDHIRAAYAAGVKHHPYEYNGMRMVDKPCQQEAKA